ncbi:hypothetical protein L226DRAFT_614320 [Lentinus tigrinus ALCF2SS1-7]|uniref:Uncharacterized protein n=1 Tax=Lentinus tigrinus ALCF2SS1-6 TaxID=1328759 RepID=A0A5C2S1P3_9APHY|nr:hypothetical protein L227DRAFT_565567 [Lentinus tigrinus ALCF2SS1-6]RPD73055.1 hypothetical protein L226DRAFT_614320 [Lentinus tigrinus ALCF2SS1-7]
MNLLRDTDPSILEACAKLRLFGAAQLDRISSIHFCGHLQSLSQTLGRLSHVGVVKTAAETYPNSHEKWYARSIQACCYAAGYQSLDGNRENDAVHALQCLCLPVINVIYPRATGEDNVALNLIFRSREHKPSIAEAQSTAAAIYMHLYLMPIEARAPHVQRYSVLGYAAHIVPFLVEALVYANNAAYTVCVHNIPGRNMVDTEPWRLFSPAMVIALLALRELNHEMAKSGFLVPGNYSWLQWLDGFSVGRWWDSLSEHIGRTFVDPRTLVGPLVPDCFFEETSGQRRIRAEVYATFMGAMTRAGRRWEQIIGIIAVPANGA